MIERANRERRTDPFVVAAFVCYSLSIATIWLIFPTPTFFFALAGAALGLISLIRSANSGHWLPALVALAIGLVVLAYIGWTVVIG